MPFFFIQRKTQLAESDAAGIIHFSNICRYVEEAEHLLLQKEGYAIDLSRPDALRWPRVRFSASYLRPILPLVTIQVELNPRRLGNSSVTWSWSIWNANRTEESARGDMKTVCCKWSGGQIQTHPLPEKLREKLSGRI